MENEGLRPHFTAMDAILKEIRFDEAGLVLAVAQQHDTGEVLMVAWMNADAIRETLETGRVCYWSRSRGKLWRKGESSGQVQRLVELRLDCDGDTILLGSDSLMHHHNIEISEKMHETFNNMSENAKTTLFLAKNGKSIAIIAISDPIKEDSAEAVRQLHDLGLEVVMLTGDNLHTAKAIAKQAGIKQFVAGVSPQEKLEQIQQLQAQGKQVAMVGDGINDAAALAQADVGIAMGGGTDIAIESADISLMHGSLKGVVRAIKISNATIHNIKQNLFGAFIYNSLGIPVAAGILFPFYGILLNPIIAGAAMAASSVTVVSNANRLRNFNPNA